MGKQKAKVRCCAAVFGERCYSWQCTRDAFMTEGGKPYCKQHAPSNVAAKQKARNEKWERESAEFDARCAAEEKRDRRRDECETAFVGIPKPAAFVKAARELAEHAGCYDGNPGIREALAAFRAADTPA